MLEPTWAQVSVCIRVPFPFPRPDSCQSTMSVSMSTRLRSNSSQNTFSGTSRVPPPLSAKSGPQRHSFRFTDPGTGPPARSRGRQFS